MESRIRNKKAKRYRLGRKRQVESDSEEEQQENVDILKKLNSINEVAREEATAYIANLTFLTPEILEPQKLNSLVQRLSIGEQHSVIYNALFAIKNLVEIDKRLIVEFEKRNLIQMLIRLCEQMGRLALSGASNTVKRVVQAIYALLLTLCEIASFEQLQAMDNSHEFRFFTQFLVKIIEKCDAIDDRQPTMQFLWHISQYFPKTKKIIMQVESKSQPLQRIFLKCHNRLQCITANVLLLVGGSLNNKIQDQMIQLFQDHVNNINLNQQYQQNFKQSECDMEEESDEDEEPKQAIKNKEQIFNSNVELANLMTQWLLTVLEEEEQMVDDEEQEQIEEEMESVNEKVRMDLKNRIKSINGVLLNCQLQFQSAEQLVDMSWRIIQISLKALKPDDVCTAIFNSLGFLLKQNTLNQINKSTVQTCMTILLEIWSKNIQKTKEKRKAPEIFNKLGQLGRIILMNNSTERSKMVALQLIGMRYNPEQFIVDKEQNIFIGQLLKQTIIQTPTDSTNLQCQILDTIFDVYCNEDFDVTFIELGFLQICQMAMQFLKNLNKKSKFLKQVLSDLKRFIEYKREMLIKQKLL